MANHGKTILVAGRNWNVKHVNISSADVHPSGALILWDTNGKKVRTYSPYGYIYYDEIVEIGDAPIQGHYHTPDFTPGVYAQKDKNARS